MKFNVFCLLEKKITAKVSAHFLICSKLPFRSPPIQFGLLSHSREKFPAEHFKWVLMECVKLRQEEPFAVLLLLRGMWIYDDRFLFIYFKSCYRFALIPFLLLPSADHLCAVCILWFGREDDDRKLRQLVKNIKSFFLSKSYILFSQEEWRLHNLPADLTGLWSIKSSRYDEAFKQPQRSP